MKELIGIPSPILAVIFLLVWIIFWVTRYAHKLRTQIEEARKEIATLREKGVRIRNDGIALFVEERTFNAWKDSVYDWNEKTKEALKKVSEADSIWFGTLDIVPEKSRVTIDYWDKFPEEHAKQLREHDRRLALLGEMIRDQWGLRKDVHR